MRRITPFVAAVLVVSACGGGSPVEVASAEPTPATTQPVDDRPSTTPDVADPPVTTTAPRPRPTDPTTTDPTTTVAASTDPTTTADTTTERPGGTDATPTLRFERTDLVSVVGDVAHVSDVLITSDDRVVAGFYLTSGEAGLATRPLTGGTWDVEFVGDAQQFRDLVELPDGSILATGTGTGRGAIVWRNAGDGWVPTGMPALPSDRSANGWDLEVLADGSVLLATDALANDPAALNPAVHRSTDGGATWTDLAPLPGLGVLALAVTVDGTILATTEESDEHDDPALAGQARVFASTDGGVSWAERGALAGANRVYDLVVLGDGTMWAGTGISGELFESTDDGRTWTALTHVPDGSKRRGTGEEAEDVTLSASRVYRILELGDGRIVVGTGNQTGDVFLTEDRGGTWVALPETGPNNVVWGLAQSPDGRLWVGTGSTTGDLLILPLG